MELHSRLHGHGPPLVLLHGLFGSNENFGAVARALAGGFTIYGLDLRNHGRSPHGEAMDYAALAADVRDTMDGHALSSAHVLGHSLGGKTAMELALSHPERVRRLVVVDIAPVAYPPRHDVELEAMRGLEPDTITSRREADDRLADAVPDPGVRQFLLKNLVRAGAGFAWRIPLETIVEQYPQIAAAPPSPGRYDGPTLFVRGGESDYLPDDAERVIRQRFPAARIGTVAGAGHWVHVEAPERFVELVRGFLEEETGDRE